MSFLCASSGCCITVISMLQLLYRLRKRAHAKLTDRLLLAPLLGARPHYLSGLLPSHPVACLLGMSAFSVCSPIRQLPLLHLRLQTPPVKSFVL